MKTIDNATIDEIRSLYKDGYTIAELVDAYGISRSSVYRIIKGINQQKERVIDLVQHYLPDYKREISPTTSFISYQYNGITFNIDYENNEFSLNYPSANVVVKSDSESIDDRIKSMENVIGVLLFIKKYLKEK